MCRMKDKLMPCALTLMLAACATTHKTTTSATKAEYDSASVVHHDSANVVKVTKDSTVLLTTQEHNIVTVVNDSTDEYETITEHIVECVDSVGNKLTTTDRTTTRNKKGWSYMSAEEYKRQQEEELKVMLSVFDSIAESRGLATGAHWQQTDSIYQSKDVEQKSTTTLWDKMKIRFNTLLVAGVIAIFVILYIQHKKKG